MEIQSEIAESFKNQTIFLTGGSGFIGKVFLAKLLTVCSDVKTIFLLVRPKRNKTPNERISDIFNFPVSIPLEILFFLHSVIKWLILMVNITLRVT